MELDWSLAKKKKDILKAVKCSADVKILRQQSITMYGLVNNDIRKIVWPLLIKPQDELQEIDERLLESHPSRAQVLLDTSRMASLLPHGLTDFEKSRIKDDVTRLILCVLIDNPSLYYYQGFHDVCYIFYSVLGEDSRAMLKNVVPIHFGIFMQETLTATVEYMELIFALLDCVRPKLLERIDAVNLKPDFALSWVITWFTHVLPNMDDVRRLFDLILATGSIMVIYLSVSIIILSESELDSAPQEFDMLYCTLAHLPKLHPVEELVREALKIFVEFPPQRIKELGNARIQKHREYVAEMSNLRKCQMSQLGYLKQLFTDWPYSNKKFLLGFTGTVISAVFGYILLQKTSSW